MKGLVLLFVILSTVWMSFGCTKQAIYESMRFKSNEVNAQNPNYNPDNVQPYTEYEAQREQYIEEQERK